MIISQEEGWGFLSGCLRLFLQRGAVCGLRYSSVEKPLLALLLRLSEGVRMRWDRKLLDACSQTHGRKAPTTDESEYTKCLEVKPDTIKSRNGLKALLLCNLHIWVL